MKTQFASDLGLARRKTGFTQDDVAHLLACSNRTIARYESGDSEPDLNEILALSIIYGRSFESFFAAKLQSLRRAIRERTCTVPPLKKPTGMHANRSINLERLSRRLDAEIELYA